MLNITLTNIHYWNPQQLKATNLKKAIKKFSNKKEVQPNHKPYKNRQIFHFQLKLYTPLKLKLSKNLQEHLKI